MTATGARRGRVSQRNRAVLTAAPLGSGSAERCADSLAAYLRCVREELAGREVTVVVSRVNPRGPQQALCASIELRPPGHDPNRGIRAGWHEELGWWAQPARPSPGSVRARRYLPGDLTPAATVVADFLTRSSELGSVEPSLHRYRLLASDDDLIEALSPRVTGGAR